MKAGASNSDKNRIRKLHHDGYSVEQISALTRVRPAQVQAVIEQIKAGTLRLTGALTDYNIGDGDSGDAVPDQNTAEGQVTAELESANASQAAEIERLQAELAESKAKERKRPGRKPKQETEDAPSEPSELQPAD